MEALLILRQHFCKEIWGSQQEIFCNLVKSTKAESKNISHSPTGFFQDVLRKNYLRPIHSNGVIQCVIGFPLVDAHIDNNGPPAHHEDARDDGEEAELVKSHQVAALGKNLTQQKAMEEKEEEGGENKNGHEGKNQPVLIHLLEGALLCCVVVHFVPCPNRNCLAINWLGCQYIEDLYVPGKG